MNLEERIQAFATLGEYLDCSISGVAFQSDKEYPPGVGKLTNLMHDAGRYNPWFIEKHVKYAFNSIATILQNDQLHQWIQPYQSVLDNLNSRKTIAVVMAGNIPAVGFHDFLCVLMAGYKFMGKLSSQDEKIIPAIAELLIQINPAFSHRISFTTGQLSGFDAIIATGSDNTSRYFEYYFGKYPNIIRKNRNGIAVITENETEEELHRFGADIFTHFGLGCRNVSKVFIPQGYRFRTLFGALKDYRYVADNHKYRNNYDYYKSIFLVNNENFEDNGFLLMFPSNQISSPVSVVHYETYLKQEDVNTQLHTQADKIQCVVSGSKDIYRSIPFGTSQTPALWDYADGIDTLEFLMGL